MFSPDERDRVRAYVLAMAADDSRVVAGAEVGGLVGGGDRWSDLDLTFAVADDVPVSDVLNDWTTQLDGSLGATHLFDVPFEAAIYRVFLLPGCLQVDLSFAPASAFGSRGPKFRLLFGRAVELPDIPLPQANELFGVAVHHAVRARFCIERGRYWQAEYWISAVRDNALALACSHGGLTTAPGRGFDDLPAETLAGARHALVTSLSRSGLLDALAGSVAVLLEQAADMPLARKLEPQLTELTAASLG